MQSMNLDELKTVVHSHEEIVAALESRDADRVRAAMRSHFESSYDRFTRSDQTQ